jgi:phytoene dehydrogenase-like protein
MHYDVVIIGAGMSGLAAGIRLAYFDRRVCILERHEVYGGLNSFYTLGGRQLDVGLHAVTNFAPRGMQSAPLAKLLRQLRIPREQFDLCEQRFSEVRFPGHRLRFANDFGVLEQQVADVFPAQIDAFRRLVADIRAYDDHSRSTPGRSARQVLNAHLSDPLLIEMVLCPVMYYGSAEEGDMDYTQFVTLFKSIFLEGLARPRGGVRTILKALVRKFRGCGGKLRTRTGVERIETNGRRVTRLILESGETLTADVCFSSAGYIETMQLCTGIGNAPSRSQAGRLSFTESISCLDAKPADLGLDATIVFFNDADTFTYARPGDLVDARSGVICCPNNFQNHDHLPEGMVRLTSLADHDRWAELDDEAYAAAKRECYRRTVERAAKFIPNFRERVVFTDFFTPRTIHRFTGHLNGAVYGAPAKVRDGRTPLNNLFICGTDQGLCGIVGAMLSGITMANLHVLQGG